MAVDGGYGEKGVPKFSPNGAPDTAVDLEAVGKFAADVGNRKVGTAARRAALSRDITATDQTWLGLEFLETDTGRSYRDMGTGTVAAWAEVTEPLANTTFGKRGTVPSPTPRLQIRAFSATATTGTSGVVEIAYPGGAFPNAVMVVLGDIADADTTTYTGWKVTPRNGSVQLLDRARFIVTNAAGARVASGQSVPIDVFAVGF